MKIKLFNETVSINSSIHKKNNINKCDISIIIRTKDEGANIKRCIEAILSQKTNYTYEIIVIDSGSRDNTIQIAEQFPIVTIIKIPQSDFNFGSSIQLGIHFANGEYCVFVSAHATPANKQWLENLINPFNMKSVAATYSKQTYQEDANFIERKSLDETFGDTKKIQEWNKSFTKFKDYRSEIAFSNASSAIRKKVALKYPFSIMCASEDREWAMRILKKGYKVVYVPSSKIYHYHNETAKQYYRRIYINSFALFQFANVKISAPSILPLWIISSFNNIKYLFNNHSINSKNILQAITYGRLYAKAHYCGARDARRIK